MPITGTMTGPGTVTITDDAAAAIQLQTELLLAQNERLIAVQNQMNNALNNMLDKTELSSKSLSDVNIAIAGIAVSLSKMNVIAAASASNQIKTNNFQVQATKDALERSGQPLPKEVAVPDQLQESIQDALSMNTAVSASGALLSYIQDTTAAIASWISGTVVYTTVEKWVSESFNSLTNSLVPPSPRAIQSNVKAMAGDPTILNNVG
jgi:cell pole-organizing protein PopZ